MSVHASRYSIVGCTHCSQLWIVEDLGQGETAECPQCGHTHQTSKLQALAHHEDPDTICDIRSRILAERAGEAERYSEMPHYAEQRERAERYLDESVEADDLEDELTDTVGLHSEMFADLVDLDGQPKQFETLVEESMEAFDRQYGVVPERLWDPLFSLDEQLDAYYGADREPITPPQSESEQSKVERGGESDASLSIRETLPIDADAIVRPIDWSVSAIHRDIFASDRMQTSLLSAIVDISSGLTKVELRDRLEDLGVDALDGVFVDRVIEVATGSFERTSILMEYVRELGTGHSTLGPGFTSTVEDIRGGAIPLLEASDEVEPTVAVVVDGTFCDPDETRADQRRDVISLLVDLSRACDVSIVAESQIERTYLWRNHRDQLPPSVEDDCNPHRRDQLSSDDVNEAVARAVDELNPDSKPVHYLRRIDAEPTSALTYARLADEFSVSQATVRTHVTQTLVKLDLVECYDNYEGNRTVSITHIGEKLLATSDAEFGRQSQLLDCVEESGKSSTKDRVNPAARDSPRDGETFYRTEWMDRPEAAAAPACARDGTLTLVKGPISGYETTEDRKTHRASYDNTTDTAVVAVRAAGPLPYTTSIATALAWPGLINQVLTDERLDSIDTPPVILRAARCIGALSDENLSNPASLREALIDWGIEIQDMTTTLRNEDMDDEATNVLRSEIIRKSHGLAGTIVHLFDVIGVDIIREIRVPEALDAEQQLEPLAKSIGISGAIQSRYCEFSVYRQLFEGRLEKLRSSFSVQVDSADPFGSLIGSIIVRGEDIHRLRPYLEDHLERPDELRDDVPEFTVPVPIRDVDRTDYQSVSKSILSRKSIVPTREGVSLLRALAATPYAAAEALIRLGSEDERRRLRPDEVRLALSTLDADDLAHDLAPSVGKILEALLAAEKPLSQTELADRAGVSARTIRNHRAALEALDIVRIDESGYRVAISFRNGDERRRNPVLPAPVQTADDLGMLDVVDALLEATLPPDRYGDPEDEAGGVLFWPPDPWALFDNPEYRTWACLAGALIGEEPPQRTSSTVSMGPTIEQQPLITYTEAEA